MNRDEFVKIDLHVHTPASSCYKGKKDDEEYLRILRKARNRALKIIAITDHNSIVGYKKILELKDRLSEDKRTLLEITDSDQTRSKIADMDRKLSLFEGVLVLPGIEFEVSNGIHLLVIFNQTVHIDHLQKFLIEAGYDQEAFGKEDPPTRPRWDIFTLYEESKKYDCIVIDAHTDSNKGIWNTIPAGRTRANCFRDPQLSALAFKNDAQREKITEVLNTADEYKRASPLSFVRFSDAHDYKQVGSQVTWVKLKKVDFAGLKVAFANPTELVSTESPSLDRILTRLIHQGIAFGVPDSSAPNLERCKKLICALSNSSGGHLLFGVTPQMNKVGLAPAEKGHKGLDEGVKEILKCFRSVTGLFLTRHPIEINVYPLQNRRVILSVQVPRGSDLASIEGDGRIYSLKNRDVTVLSGGEIQQVVEERTAGTIEARIWKRMSGIEKSCQLIRNLFASMPLMRKFEKASIPIPMRPEFPKTAILAPAGVEKLRNSKVNGTSRGNLFFLHQKQAPSSLSELFL